MWIWRIGHENASSLDLRVCFNRLHNEHNPSVLRSLGQNTRQLRLKPGVITNPSLPIAEPLEKCKNTKGQTFSSPARTTSSSSSSECYSATLLGVPTYSTRISPIPSHERSTTVQVRCIPLRMLVHDDRYSSLLTSVRTNGATALWHCSSTISVSAWNITAHKWRGILHAVRNAETGVARGQCLSSVNFSRFYGCCAC